MKYNLYLDDIRNPIDGEWIIARSSSEAIKIVEENGFPDFMSLDHDLGGDDTTMVFLKHIVNHIWDGKSQPPPYTVHSANPVGKQNIISYLETWKKSV